MNRRLANKQCLTPSSLSDVGPSQILPFLSVGRQEDAISIRTMQDMHITHVINVSTTGDRATFLEENDNEHFLRIPINDCLNAQLLPHLEKTYIFIEKARLDNGRIFIHCLAGISRSPAIAIAYVMRYLHLSVDDAYRYVKQRRPQISPNFNFLGQLSEYERILSIPSTANIAPQMKCIPIESPLNDRRCFVEINGSSNTGYQTNHVPRPKSLFPPMNGLSGRSSLPPPTCFTTKLTRPTNISFENSHVELINSTCNELKDKQPSEIPVSTSADTIPTSEQTELINTCFLSTISPETWASTPIFDAINETTTTTTTTTATTTPTPDVLSSSQEILAV